MIYYVCKYTPIELFEGFGEDLCRSGRNAGEF